MQPSIMIHARLVCAAGGVELKFCCHIPLIVSTGCRSGYGQKKTKSKTSTSPATAQQQQIRFLPTHLQRVQRIKISDHYFRCKTAIWICLAIIQSWATRKKTRYIVVEIGLDVGCMRILWFRAFRQKKILSHWTSLCQGRMYPIIERLNRIHTQLHCD